MSSRNRGEIDGDSLVVIVLIICFMGPAMISAWKAGEAEVERAKHKQVDPTPEVVAPNSITSKEVAPKDPSTELGNTEKEEEELISPQKSGESSKGSEKPSTESGKLPWIKDKSRS